jgi:hypothetical protein
MTPEAESDLKLEIGHVLTIDVVAYSTLLITHQTRVSQRAGAFRSRCPLHRKRESQRDVSGYRISPSRLRWARDTKTDQGGLHPNQINTAGIGSFEPNVARSIGFFLIRQSFAIPIAAVNKAANMS